jgi:hypothetical protein
MKERFRWHLAFAGMLLVAQSLFAASTVQFSARFFSVAEHVRHVVILIPVVRTVERMDDLETLVSCEYYTISGTATADEDFTPAKGTLHFGAGVTNQTIVVRIHNDALVENQESFRVLLTNAGDAVLGSVRSATIAIQDRSFFVVSRPAKGLSVPHIDT